MSESNYFHCPRCRDLTRHIRISASEFMSRYYNGSSFMSFIGRINDFSGGYQLSNFISGKKQWKCSKCGSCSQRKSDGTIFGDLF